MYEVINEELGIKACGIGDLTMDQAGHFFGQWEDGVKLGELTMFFEPQTDNLVLNKDNKKYGLYLEIAESYMVLSADGRREARKNCPPEARMALNVLENCLKSRRVEKELFRATNNTITSKVSRMVLNEVIKRHEPISAVFIAFRYGVMQGKRMERAKRKK